MRRRVQLRDKMLPLTHGAFMPTNGRRPDICGTLHSIVCQQFPTAPQWGGVDELARIIRRRRRARNPILCHKQLLTRRYRSAAPARQYSAGEQPQLQIN